MHPRPSSSSRTRRAVALCTLGALLAGPLVGQTAADLEAIRAEMKAARELYEARIAELEKRLAAVEQKPAAATPAKKSRSTKRASA